MANYGGVFTNTQNDIVGPLEIKPVFFLVKEIKPV